MIIYVARNTTNGKCYIGQTTQALVKRKQGHLYDSDRDKSRNLPFANAIRKYGWEAFEWEVLEECIDEADLDMAERFWIKTYNSLAPSGYNLDSGGNSQKVRSLSTRRKISESRTGVPLSAKTREKMSASKRGKPLTEANRAAISRAAIGRPKSRLEIEALTAANRARGILDWDKVRAIRDARAQGAKLQPLADIYGVSLSQIARIVKGERWKEGA